MTFTDKKRDNSEENTPDWFAGVNEKSCLHIDARPILATGTDPLSEILAGIDSVTHDVIIYIEAPFNPVPLRRLLSGKGYDSHGVKVSDDHWKVYFKYYGKPQQVPKFSDMPAFPIERRDGVLEMDLRGMAPPNPMVAILRVIEKGEGGHEFRVRLDRDPIYLHPELVERNWATEIIEEGGAGMVIRLFNVTGKDATC